MSTQSPSPNATFLITPNQLNPSTVELGNDQCLRHCSMISSIYIVMIFRIICVQPRMSTEWTSRSGKGGLGDVPKQSQTNQPSKPPRNQSKPGDIKPRSSYIESAGSSRTPTSRPSIGDRDDRVRSSYIEATSPVDSVDDTKSYSDLGAPWDPTGHMNRKDVDTFPSPIRPQSDLFHPMHLVENNNVQNFPIGWPRQRDRKGYTGIEEEEEPPVGYNCLPSPEVIKCNHLCVFHVTY